MGKGYRLKFEAAPGPDGSKRTRYVTFHGDRADAKKELSRLIAAEVDGKGVDPSKITVVQHLRAWLSGNPGLSVKTAERYQQLAEQQIIPYLGAIPLQRLKLVQIEEWHIALLRHGGKNRVPFIGTDCETCSPGSASRSRSGAPVGEDRPQCRQRC